MKMSSRDIEILLRMLVIYSLLVPESGVLLRDSFKCSECLLNPIVDHGKSSFTNNQIHDDEFN